MKKINVISILLCFTLSLYSQTSFETILGGEKDERVFDVLVDTAGNYIIGGGVSNEAQIDSKNFVIRIDSMGNLISQKIFPNNVGTYECFENIYLIANKLYALGISFTGFSSSFITYKMLDLDFNILTEKNLKIPEGKRIEIFRTIKDINDNFVCCGTTLKNTGNEYILEPFVYKLTLDGDSISSHFWNTNQVTFCTDILETKSFGEYYAFTSFPVDYQHHSILALSSDLDSVGSYLIPNDMGFYLSGEWSSDSTLIVVGKNANSSYKHLAVELLNENFEALSYQTFFKDYQMIEYPALANSVGVKGNDVYIGGTTNMDYSNVYFSTFDSWYHIVKLNSEDLSTVWEKWYGGDAYYILYSIKATTDGGCIMVGTRYDYEVQNMERDIYIVKVDADGLITWEKDIPLPQAAAQVFPNPGKSLNLKSTLTDATFRLSNLEGKSILQQEIKQEMTSFDTRGLAQGTYLWTLTKAGKLVASGKWVKDE